MPKDSNKLSQFWNELKRRNVFRVITVYAGAAFVLLELVDMIREPFELPNWSFKLVVVILSIGLIIAVILSWIYDIHPEGGVVKTEPAGKVKSEEIPKSSSGWKIASYLSFVVIIALIVLNIIPRSGKKEILDKSIAVLPFESLSKDEELQYQADGVMDAIVLHLSKIKDLRVMSRTSVEQYRDTKKTVPEICEEMGVSYLLEGSFQKSGDQMRLIVQLIQARTERHVWANNYDREWKDIFAVQSEVAQAVAQELHAIITPQEQQRIEKPPTTDLTAYDFYMRGVDEFMQSLYYGENQGGASGKAKAYFLKALEYDPEFAAAYTGLASLSLDENLGRSLMDTAFADSTLVLINLALSIDDELAEAYRVRGDYYKYERGNYQQAIYDFEKAIELNPSYLLAYQSLAYLYVNSLFDFIPAFKNLQKALLMQKGIMEVSILKDFAFAYRQIGFFEQARSYFEKALELNGDTLGYLANLAMTEQFIGNYVEDLRIEQKIFEKDSSSLEHYFIGEAYFLNRQFDNSLYHYEKYLGSNPKLDLLIVSVYRIGYVYWKNGMKETALEYFNKQIEICKRARETNSDYYATGYASYALAATWAFMGDKDKAYENLKAFSERERFSARMIPLIKSDPLFDSIRDEPEFQQIVRDVEAKYQAEHERVRLWLEENDML